MKTSHCGEEKSPSSELWMSTLGERPAHRWLPGGTPAT